MIRAVQITPQGVVVQCTQCGERVHVRDPNQFAQQHRCKIGAGDMIARATGALGIKPCKPCEKRKQMLNDRFPRVWRR